MSVQRMVPLEAATRNTGVNHAAVMHRAAIDAIPAATLEPLVTAFRRYSSTDEATQRNTACLAVAREVGILLDATGLA